MTIVETKLCMGVTVAQRFIQYRGFDFDVKATYARMVDLTVQQLLLAKAVSDDLAIRQCDFKTAHIEDELVERVLAQHLKGLVFDG